MQFHAKWIMYILWKNVFHLKDVIDHTHLVPLNWKVYHFFRVAMAAIHLNHNSDIEKDTTLQVTYSKAKKGVPSIKRVNKETS